ncbi:hypothetical protein [Halomonas sp. MMSF_3323]|uniref:Uncharacterized protein n=1 Tax=Halomonas sp. RT37 TaxID=2950872 RepID=A0AAU7KE05_9GAMM|nr:hypothetical protein [Halomonas sp. MMSF_3323]|tara:strand:- start:361 stop:726 length:366 start_codon:yes stop_codon:yes gene_type:complete
MTGFLDSEYDDFSPEIKALSASDIQEFLEHIEGPKSCLYCGAKKLAIVTAVQPRQDQRGIEITWEKPALTRRHVHEIPPSGFFLQIPAFHLCCSNCGYNMSFSVGPLLEWMRDREEGVSAD